MVVPKVSLLIWTGYHQVIVPGQNIRGARHLREGVQLPPVGVRHQRHHRQPQVRGVGAQRQAGARHQCDQGAGLALHLQLHPPHRGSDPLPGGQLLLPPRQSPPRHRLSPRAQQGRGAPTSHRAGPGKHSTLHTGPHSNGFTCAFLSGLEHRTYYININCDIY